MRFCLYNKERQGYYVSWRYDTVRDLCDAVLFSSEKAARASARKSRLEWEVLPVMLKVIRNE